MYPVVRASLLEAFSFPFVLIVICFLPLCSLFLGSPWGSDHHLAFMCFLFSCLPFEHSELEWKPLDLACFQSSSLLYVPSLANLPSGFLKFYKEVCTNKIVAELR